MAAQQWQMKYVSPYKPRILTFTTQRILVFWCVRANHIPSGPVVVVKCQGSQVKKSGSEGPPGSFYRYQRHRPGRQRHGRPLNAEPP
jgi:hypothetical protein